jgi:hypothetical protein
MRCRLTALTLVTASLLSAVIIDRVALVVGNAIIKDSDIERDVRVVSFLNSQPLTFTASARKAAVGRLLDQVFIRREIRLGDYAPATLSDADKQLAAIKEDRFKTPGSYEAALKRYGINDLELRTQFQWQLSVLRFIDVRFRPAAYVSDAETETYYREHTEALKRQYPGKTTLNDLREDIRGVLTGEKVNQLFFSWLDEQRTSSKIIYHEEGLR